MFEYLWIVTLSALRGIAIVLMTWGTVYLVTGRKTVKINEPGCETVKAKLPFATILVSTIPFLFGLLSLVCGISICIGKKLPTEIDILQVIACFIFWAAVMTVGAFIWGCAGIWQITVSEKEIIKRSITGEIQAYPLEELSSVKLLKNKGLLITTYDGETIRVGRWCMGYGDIKERFRSYF